METLKKSGLVAELLIGLWERCRAKKSLSLRDAPRVVAWGPELLWIPALPDCPSSVLLHSAKHGNLFDRMALVWAGVSSLGPRTPDKSSCHLLAITEGSGDRRHIWDLEGVWVGWQAFSTLPQRKF